MKEVLFIDVKNILIDTNFDGEQFYMRIKKILKEEFKLEEKIEIQKEINFKSIQELENKTIKDKWKVLLEKIFKKIDFEICYNFLISKIQKDWTKVNVDKQILPNVLDNFNLEDFKKLNDEYDVNFFLLGKFNSQKKILLETTLCEFIDQTQLNYFENNENLSLLKNTDPSKAYFISNDLALMQNLLKNYEQFQDYNYSQNFIHCLSDRISQKEYDQQQKLLKKENIQNDIFTLKSLYNKMRFLKQIKSKKFDEKKVIKVGVYFHKSLYKCDRKGLALQDNFPLFFTFFDPLSENNQKQINIFLTKYSYIMKDKNLLTDEKIQTSIKQTLQVLQEIEKKNNYKIFIVNTIKDFMVFADRKIMAEFFIDLFSEKQFQNSLKEKFKDITLKFPQTLQFNQINQDAILKELQIQKLEFPCILKSCKCVSILSKFSHKVILLKNEEQFKKYFENNQELLEKMKPIVIQEFIEDLQDIQKIYYIFKKKFLTRYEGIEENDDSNQQILDTQSELKNHSKIQNFSQIEHEVQDFIGNQLEKKGFINLGIDLCCKKNQKEFFVIDSNPDALNILNHGDIDTQKKMYQQRMIDYYTKFNQIQQL